jgi:hypothetical protein
LRQWQMSIFRARSQTRLAVCAAAPDELDKLFAAPAPLLPPRPRRHPLIVG